MYLDLEDYRPDTPRVNRAMSVREGVLIALLAHAIGIIAWLLMPPLPPNRATLDSLSEDPPVRYVQMMPTQMPEVARQRPEPVDRSPKADAVPVPKADTPPDKPTASPTEKPTVTGDLPAPVVPPSSTSSTVPDIASKVTADPTPSLTRPTTTMGNSLRNLQQFLQTQSVAADSGDGADQNADIKFDDKGIDFNPWLRRFVAQVKRNWLVPQNAMMMRGNVVIQFYVLRNGTITDLKIVRTSGIPPFDSAAFNSLKLSNPTLALPTEYPDDKAFFTVTFHYNERER
jgi:TonB family protein